MAKFLTDFGWFLLKKVENFKLSEISGQIKEC